MKKAASAFALGALVCFSTGVQAYSRKPTKQTEKAFQRLSWNAKTVRDKFNRGYWETAIYLLEGNQDSFKHVRDLVVKAIQDYPKVYKRLEQLFEELMFALGKMVYAFELGNKIDPDILGSQINAFEQASQRLNQAQGMVREFNRFIKPRPGLQGIITPEFLMKMRNAVSDLSSMAKGIQRSFVQELKGLRK